MSVLVPNGGEACRSDDQKEEPEKQLPAESASESVDVDVSCDVPLQKDVSTGQKKRIFAKRRR